MVSHIGGEHGKQHSLGPAEKEAVIAVTKTEAITDPTQKQKDDPIRAEEAKKMTGNLNKFLESVDTQLRFKMHDELNEYYVTIVDSKTDEVIREIPSKKLMDMHAEMKKFLGLLIDRKI